MTLNDIDFYPFYMHDGNLYMETVTKKGETLTKISNFTPFIQIEKTVDDGAVTDTRLVLRGKHSDGTYLPAIEITAAELSSFNWLIEKWGAKCIIEVGQNKKDNLRYFIQLTAMIAEHQTEYHVTGWKEIEGKWEYLLPGDEVRDVKLRGKLQHYEKACEQSENDLNELYNMHLAPPAKKEIIYPLLAYTFLTPLNEFLRQAGCVPKFVLFLTGKTGTRKSTLAALFLSFFGRFTSTDLPMSFRDTANSIIANAFTLKDVLTCIDDFYPADSIEAKKLNATAQTVLRAYGDRTGRARLRSDSTLMESRPPQGNAIITGELSPSVGESGTARYFTLELKENDVDLTMLTAYQEDAAEGVFRRCLFAYTEWLKQRILSDGNHTEEFITMLRDDYNSYRSAFRQSGVSCHGRLSESVASLMIGMRFFLLFLEENNIVKSETSDVEFQKFSDMLTKLARAHTDLVKADNPVHIFIKKLFALIDGGKVLVTERNRPESFDPYPPGYIGCEDDDYYYLNKDLAHSAVKKLCTDQGESFPFSAKALIKALAEDGYIKTTSTGNTVSVRYCGKNRRFIALDKQKVEQLIGTE